MGRKIPVRKHLGVRDPLKQRDEREAKLSRNREAPPTSDGANDRLPKRLLEINKARQLIKEGKYNVKKKRKNKKKNSNEKPPISSAQFVGPQDQMLPGMKRPEKAIPTLQQRPGEADKAFLHRCSQICDQLIKETQYEEKHKVTVIRNSETGMVESLKKQGKDEIEDLIKDEMKKAKDAAKPKRRKTKKKQEEEAVEAAAKEEKLLKRKNRRKLKRQKTIQKAIEKKQEKKGGSLVVHETVKFGEVADRPPEFKVRPRKSIAEKNVKDIMFNQMLIKGKLAEEDSKQKMKESATKNKAVGKTVTKSLLTGKRKDLPVGERRIIEAQQKSAVAAYRLLKARKEKVQ